MSSEYKFFSICWLVGGAAVITLILTIYLHGINRQNNITEAIKHGANPIDVACAYANISMDNCILRAAK